MNKVAVITGGSRGIGHATVECFLSHDWEVINFSRTPCDLSGVINIKADFSEQDWVKQTADSLHSTLENAKQICLVHNAGKLIKDSVRLIDPNKFREMLEINLVAPSELNQMILPYMQKGSSIIYIGSTLSEMGVPDTASYVIAKHGVVGLMRSTCQDLMYSGIHTCCICPGFVETDMLKEHLHHDQEILDSIKERLSEKRLIQPKEIADFVWYCANHSVINGSVLHANLGLSAS